MTMQEMVQPPAPFVGRMEQKSIERAVDRANARLFEVGGKLLEQLDASHSGWFDIPERERAAAYSLFPTEAQMQVAIAMVSPTPDPETLQMVPSPYESLRPLVEAIAVSPNPFIAWLMFLGALRPDKAEKIARDAKRLGHKIEVGKL